VILNSLLALINGALIGLNRAMNARLGVTLGAPAASLWNHWVGFVFLLILVLAWGQNPSFREISQLPPYVLFGGVAGASFVALNSFIFPKLGATQTTLLIVAGEMIVGGWIDAARGNIKSVPIAAVGVLFILAGSALSPAKKNGDA
jgi:transporter family-2 protein